MIIVDQQTQRPVPAGEVGEIWIGGPTVAAGYWANPAATQQTFEARLADGSGPYLRSGDLGVQVAGELYVTGRIKDLIVVRGRNLYPQDLEYTAEQAWPGLAASRQAAFGIDTADGEQVVLVLEVTPELPPDPDAAIQAIRQAVMDAHGVRAADVVLVKRGSVPRTTSGKIRRRACRDRYLAGELKVVAALLAGPPAAEAAPAAEAPGSAAGAAVRGSATGLLLALRDRIAALLGLPADRLRPDLPLVAQGIDSLRAAELCAVLRDEYGIEAELAELLDDRPLAELAGELTRSARAPMPAGRNRPVDSAAGDDSSAEASGVGAVGAVGAVDVEASPAQQRIWLLDRMGAGPAYHVAGGLRMLGPVDLSALRQAFGDVLRRHPGLRTTFSNTGNPAGAVALRRMIQPWTEPELPLLDLSGEPNPAAALAGRCRTLAEQPFDLARQWPVRGTLLRLSAAEHVLFAVFHHIAVDGSSLRLLAAELESGYEAAAGSAEAAALAPAGAAKAAGAASITASPCARAEDPAIAERDAEYWRQALVGMPELELPTDRPRGTTVSYAGDTVPLGLPAELAEEIRQLAEREHATPFMVLLAGYATLLAGYSGQDALVIGSPVSRRAAAADPSAVELLIDTLPIPLRVPAGQSFRELLAEVRRQCLAAHRHSGASFERIVQDRAAAGGRPDALVRALLAYHGEPLPAWRQRGIIVTPFEFPVPGAQCDLAVHLNQVDDDPGAGYTGHLSYATALFDRATAGRLADALVAVLRSVTEQPGRPVSAAALQSGEQRRVLLEEFSGARLSPLADGPVGRLFCEQVDRGPDAIAVSFTDPELTDDELTDLKFTDPELTDGELTDRESTVRQLTYRQLDERANQLAAVLRELGVGAGELVGMCLQRSERLPMALLAILQAGGCVLALDPDYPPHRLDQICAEAQPRVLLTESGTRQLLTTAGHRLDLDADADAIRRQPTGRLTVTVRPQDLAFAVYTSGSTGRPKGAMNTHAGLANRLVWARQQLPQQPGDAVLHKTPIGFDVAIGELLWPLVSGLRLVIARPGGHRDPGYLARTITEAGVRVCHFVPSMLRAFLADPAAADCRHTLHRVLCSGEELPADLGAQFARTLPGVALHNLYGPAEAAIEVSAARVDQAREVAGRLSIGAPLPGVRLYVLSPPGEPVPIGVPGELHIGGVALAHGYLGSPGLTAERFVPDPFGTSGRLYRTGDRARWRSDGTLEFLGRTDDQLKIRGQRVEPAEIEAALTNHPAVSAAAVRAESNSNQSNLGNQTSQSNQGDQSNHGEQRMMAYLVCTEPVPTATELRESLARRLPRYMVPAGFVRLAELPIGPNGKVDRGRLAAAGGQPLREADHTAPGNPLEQALADIWAELLGVPRVGVHDDFYALGGHSLLAVRVVARVREVFGIELDVADLLLHQPTVAGLAEVVLQRQLAQASDETLARALAQVSAMSEAEAAAAIARGWTDDRN